MGFKNGRTTVMATLNLERAFDTIDHNALIFKIKLKFTPALIKLIKPYLDGRSFSVRVQGVVSDQKKVAAGVPQGGILGPLLYIIFMYDLPTHARTKLSIFADDTAVRATSGNADLAAKWVQEHLTALSTYFDLWKIKLSVAKCQIIHFSKTTTTVVPQICISGEHLPVVKKVKYLGMVLQSNMKFGEHVKHVKKKATIIKSKLSSLIGPRSGLLWENKVFLVKALIRPVLTYNLHILSDMCKSEWKKLEAVQNKALRYALGIRPDRNNGFRQMRTEELLEKTKAKSLSTTALEMKKKFVTACQVHRNFVVRKLNY